MNPVVEEAARHLGRWRGTGMAWSADVEWTIPEDAENGSNDKLSVAWRGRVEEGAARSIRGGSKVRQHRSWSRSNAAAVIPCHRSNDDIAAALAMARLEGPHEPLLMLVCCEDLTGWPTVRAHAIAALGHPNGHEAVTDAMHRIMWRRPVMTLQARAKSLRMRKQAYAVLRDCAAATLTEWLTEASRRFLAAMG